MDDLEERLRAWQPGEPPPGLMRRLRHAEPDLRTEGRWSRMLIPFAAAFAAVGLFLMLTSADRSTTDASAMSKRRPTPRSAPDFHTEGNHPGFDGSLAMNIRLGASPDLIPVSLRPDYDPRPHARFDRFDGNEWNLRVEWPILNNNHTQ